MMSKISPVGTLEYILVMSNDANWTFELNVTLLRSSIRCTEFFTLNVYGRGIYVCSFFFCKHFCEFIGWCISPVYDWSDGCVHFAYLYHTSNSGCQEIVARECVMVM
jgi:hypothetical protein